MTKATRTVTQPGDEPDTNAKQNDTALDTGAGSPAPDVFQAKGEITGAATGGGGAGAEISQPTAAGVSAEQFAELMQLVQRQQQQISQLTAAGNRAAESVGKVEPLPDYHKTLATKPTSPVLTEKGWIVPDNWIVASSKGA
jgi:hypothetical protein